MRKFARELGVDLSRVNGQRPKGPHLQRGRQRLRQEGIGHAGRDGGGAAAPFDLLPWPKIDFAQFGPVESKPLSRIRKIAKANLRAQLGEIPHVTQFDEADITELEAFRKEINQAASGQGRSLTMLAFILKALVAAADRSFPSSTRRSTATT